MANVRARLRMTVVWNRGIMVFWLQVQEMAVEDFGVDLYENMEMWSRPVTIADLMKSKFFNWAH